MNQGFTLLEVCVVLGLMAIAFSVALPPARRLRDGLAVRGARESAAALILRAKGEALARGGASVWVGENPGTIRVEAGPDTLATLDVEAEFGVELELAGGSSEAWLRFDGLGLGRVASRTLWFSKADVSAPLVISSFGRLSFP